MTRAIAMLAAMTIVSAAAGQDAGPASIASTVFNGHGQSDPSAFGLDLEDYKDVRQHIEQGQFAVALKALQAREPAHQNDPKYFNLVGIVALKAGDFSAAVSALERVVLMQPDNAGAWLDLAIASVGVGNASSAVSYFDYVEEEFAPPPALRTVIAQYRARLASLSHPSSPWRSYAEALVGVDSNANSGIRSSSIPLTFGAERVELALDPSFQARSDRYKQVGIGTRVRHEFGANLVELAVGARVRAYAREDDFSTVNVNLSGGVSRITKLGDISGWLHLERLWLGGGPLLNSVRAVAQIERPYENCRLSFGMESESRRYLSLSYLNADIFWGQAGVACDWQIARQPLQTIILGRTGDDRPTGDRPGGKTRHDELIMQATMPFASGVRAELSLAFATTQDTAGYSPLLEDNAIRRLGRRNTRLLIAYPLRFATELFIVTEENRSTSNLGLFRQNGKSVSIGIRQHF